MSFVYCLFRIIVIRHAFVVVLLSLSQSFYISICPAISHFTSFFSFLSPFQYIIPSLFHSCSSRILFSISCPNTLTSTLSKSSGRGGLPKNNPIPAAKHLSFSPLDSFAVIATIKGTCNCSLDREVAFFALYNLIIS